MRTERYRIIEEIGEGYYAKVYRAWDRQRGTEVAIKYAKPFEDAQMKIHHEFTVLSKFNHPNILKVFDFDGWGKKPYFTSEYVPGKPITEYFTTHPLSELPNVMNQLLAALATIHSHGYLHLDLKPDNILIIPKQNMVKVLDLGFAELLSEKTTPVGTLGYLAPEFLSRAAIDYRADLYSIGVLLYYIYTGRPPFDLKSPISTLKDQLSGNIPEPIEINPKVRPRINNLIMRLLSPDPMSRPSTCHELLAEFEATFRRVRKKKKKRVFLPELSGILFAPGILGRDEEIEDFKGILPLKGRTIYVLKGESGFGKTTLINNFGFKVQLERIDTIKYLPSSGRPSLIQSLLEHLSLDIKGCRIEDRDLIYERIFRKIRENLPFAIVIDDAHSLSDSDLELIRYIVFGFNEDDRFLLLIAGESGEWEEMLAAIDDIHLHELKPFDRNLIEELLTRIFGVVINPHWLSNWLYQKTGGRPQAILDIINLAFRIGAMKYVRGGWEYDPVRLEALETPDSLIEPTIDSLSDEMRFAVEALMVSRTPVPITALYLALRGEKVDIAREFRRLWFIEEVNTPTGSAFRIRGEGLRQQLVDGLAKKKRSDTAAALLKAMEKISGGDGRDYIYALADLSIEANLLRKIRLYCRKAAETAYKNFLFSRALHYFNVLKRAGEVDVDEYIGDCYWMLGNLTEALNSYNRVRESTELLVKKSRVLRNLKNYQEALLLLTKVKAADPRILVERGAALIGLERIDEAKRTLNRALELARKRRNRGIEFKARYYLCDLYYRGKRYDEALKMAREVVNLARALDPEDLATSLILMANILEVKGDRDGFLTTLNEAERIIDENGLLRLKRYIVEWRMTISHNSGDLIGASRYAREFLTVMERVGEYTGIVRGLIMEGVIATYLLNIDHARRQFQRALRLAGENKALRANCLHNLAWLYCSIFDFSRAEDYLNNALNLHLELEDNDFVLSSQAMKARIYIRQKMLNQAGEILKKITVDKPVLRMVSLYYNIERKNLKAASATLEHMRKIKLDFSDAIELRILSARLQARKGNVEEAIETLKRLIEELGQTNNYLCYLHSLLALADVIIENNAYGHLDLFKNALSRIESLIRGKGLEFIERRVKVLREEAFDRLMVKGVEPGVTKILRKLADAVNLYMGDEGIFDEILDILIAATRAERGIIFIKGEGGLKIAAGRGVDRQTI
ncbi:hypothetical protein DRP53_03445, partial [candidate division WOR-3 bacterium]